MMNEADLVGYFDISAHVVGPIPKKKVNLSENLRGEVFLHGRDGAETGERRLTLLCGPWYKGKNDRAESSVSDKENDGTMTHVAISANTDHVRYGSDLSSGVSRMYALPPYTTQTRLLQLI